MRSPGEPRATRKCRRLWRPRIGNENAVAAAGVIVVVVFCAVLAFAAWEFWLQDVFYFLEQRRAK